MLLLCPLVVVVEAAVLRRAAAAVLAWGRSGGAGGTSRLAPAWPAAARGRVSRPAAATLGRSSRGVAVVVVVAAAPAVDARAAALVVVVVVVVTVMVVRRGSASSSGSSSHRRQRRRGRRRGRPVRVGPCLEQRCNHSLCPVERRQVKGRDPCGVHIVRLRPCVEDTAADVGVAGVGRRG